jgi:hypothetical protein
LLELIWQVQLHAGTYAYRIERISSSFRRTRERIQPKKFLKAVKKEYQLDKIFVKEFKQFAKEKNKEAGYEKWYIDSKTLQTNDMNESEFRELAEYLETTPHKAVEDAVGSGELKQTEQIIIDAKEKANEAFISEQAEYLSDGVDNNLQKMKDEPAVPRGTGTKKK